MLKEGPVILYFYPADFTPGCTREACSIRDLHREIGLAGLKVAGISPQSPESHRRFREKYNLPFTLLSDETKEVIRMFGVNGPLGFWVQRVTYLINQDRIIKGRVRAHFSIDEHEAFIRRAIEIRGPACLELHAQYGRPADGWHGHDVQRVEFLIADSRHLVHMRQLCDQLRHGVAVSDDDGETAAVFAQHAPRELRAAKISLPRLWA